MTTKTAIEIIKEIKSKICSGEYVTAQSEALDMAINSLYYDRERYNTGYNTGYKDACLDINLQCNKEKIKI